VNSFVWHQTQHTATKTINYCCYVTIEVAPRKHCSSGKINKENCKSWPAVAENAGEATHQGMMRYSDEAMKSVLQIQFAAAVGYMGKLWFAVLSSFCCTGRNLQFSTRSATLSLRYGFLRKLMCPLPSYGTMCKRSFFNENACWCT